MSYKRDILIKKKGWYVMVQNWNSEQFRDEVLRSGRAAGVEFYSETCPACRALGVVLDRVSEKYGDKLVFGKINVNREEALAEKYAIRSVPTLMVFCDGRSISERVGSMGQGELSSFIDGAIDRIEENR